MLNRGKVDQHEHIPKGRGIGKEKRLSPGSPCLVSCPHHQQEKQPAFLSTGVIDGHDKENNIKEKKEKSQVEVMNFAEIDEKHSPGNCDVNRVYAKQAPEIDPGRSCRSQIQVMEKNKQGYYEHPEGTQDGDIEHMMPVDPLGMLTFGLFGIEKNLRRIDRGREIGKQSIEWIHGLPVRMAYLSGYCRELFILPVMVAYITIDGQKNNSSSGAGSGSNDIFVRV